MDIKAITFWMTNNALHAVDKLRQGLKFVVWPTGANAS